MRVFVTGATGVLGRSAVRLLNEAGHQVRALSRSLQNTDLLHRLGAEPVEADLFAPVSLRSAVRGSEAILHLATNIPPSKKFRLKSAWSTNDEIRRRGTRNLVDAALDLGIATFIYPSVCFVYPDAGSNWIDSQTVRPVPHWMTVTTLDAEAAVSRLAARGRRGVILRMGAFYGPASVQTQEQFKLARRNLAIVFGDENAYHSSIWVEDAASAVVCALQHAPSGTYDIVDDEPLANSEIMQVLARVAGRHRLLPIPNLILRLSVGAQATELLARSLRVSNRRFKEATGWAPRVSTPRVGWQIIAEGATQNRTQPIMKI